MTVDCHIDNTLSIGIRANCSLFSPKGEGGRQLYGAFGASVTGPLGSRVCEASLPEGFTGQPFLQGLGYQIAYL
jgi:hypothetical protein